ncbi:MAG: MmcQ/YjbR family DNA-binding protein [Vicinamibacterales bacterium]
MTADNFRDIALSLHGAIERAHMGHPDFRANGRIFASLQAHERTGTVKLTPMEQREFMRAHPKVFAPAPGAWGRQGWTEVRLSEADIGTARAALMVAWQGVGEAPRSRRSPKPRTTRAARPSRKRRS